MSDEVECSKLTRGLLWGGLGLLVFSITLPATKAAVPELGIMTVGLGRGAVAAIFAALVLFSRRDPLPNRRHWLSLTIVALGVVVGFPLLTALALTTTPAAHGSVVIGLIPAATAIFAVVRANERPTFLFWIGCLAGFLAVLAFAAIEGAGRVQPADLLLLGAVLSAGLGYAEGGRLARDIGAWRVICWALVISGPLLAIPVAFNLPENLLSVSRSAWLGFGWVSLGSAFLGFFAWYHGLALGGVARVGQLQLLQPILALAWSAILLGETISSEALVCSLFVISAVTLCVRAGRPAGTRERTLLPIATEAPLVCAANAD